jgi:4-hydroxyphenylacetate 3-monooxygenase
MVAAPCRAADDLPSLYVTYVIIPPHVDRSRVGRGQRGAYIQVGVVDERDAGIVVRGSQKLGTGSAISDEVFVTWSVYSSIATWS